MGGVVPLTDRTAGVPGGEGPALEERRALFTFRTSQTPFEAVTRVKGSRFLARLEPCRDRQEAERLLGRFREEYHDATNLCWAWRLLSEPEPGEASSDAGEPSGTAGVPILSALRSEDLWNVLGVVVRWFGGTKLGRGGLIRAYREATAAAISGAGIVTSARRCSIEVTAPVDRVGDIHRVLSSFEVTYLQQRVEEASATIGIEVRAEDLERLRDRISDATAGAGRISDPDPGREGNGT